MNKIDRERADVLRAELARFCWLAMYDDAGGERAGRLLQQRLTAVKAIGMSAPMATTYPTETMTPE